jgi:short-subunit dehydrogenase
MVRLRDNSYAGDFVSRYGPTAVVTGSGRGIGYGYARALAARGLDLLLTDVDRDAVEAVAASLRSETGRKVTVVVADMTEPHSAELLAAAADELGVGLLVCNQLTPSQAGRFLDGDPELYRDEVGANVCAYVELANRFCRRFRDQGRGGLLIMSSMTGVVGSPYVTTYGASKAFLLAFGSALAYELRNSGVDVVTLVPGAVKTATYEKAERQQTSAFRPMDVDDFVREALAALGSKRVTTPGRKNAMTAALLGRVLPRSVAVSIMGRNLEKLLGHG